METRIVPESEIEQAAEALRRGEPVVFPTETVYGLGASAFDPQAIEKIFAIKGRPKDNPLIVHIASLEQAERLAEDLPPAFYRLANRFWPGPLTLVVKRKKEVPAAVSAGHPTIAIRMPAHPVARQLIEKAGVPLAAPSANLSGRPSPTRVRDVVEDLNGKVGLVVDGGECEVGIESTVLSLYRPAEPTLLRPGTVSREILEEILGSPIALLSGNRAPFFSPGMKYRHYAPKAPIRLVPEMGELRGPFILSPVLVPGRTVRPLNSQTFYAQLREADRLEVPEIEIYCPPSLQKETGLMDRLLRASGEIS